MFPSTLLQLPFHSVSLQLCTWVPLNLCFKRWSKRDLVGNHVQTRRRVNRRRCISTRWRPAVGELGKHSSKSYSRPRLDKSQRLEKAFVISQSALLWRAAWSWRVRYHGWNDKSEMNECLPCAPGSLSQHPGGGWKDDCRHRDKTESGEVEKLALPILHLDFVLRIFTNDIIFIRLDRG